MGKHAGKGPQPRRVSMKTWARNYDYIFRRPLRNRKNPDGSDVLPLSKRSPEERKALKHPNDNWITRRHPYQNWMDVEKRYKIWAMEWYIENMAKPFVAFCRKREKENAKTSP